MAIPEMQEGIKQLTLGFYAEYQKGNPRWVNLVEFAQKLGWCEEKPDTASKSKIIAMAGTLEAQGHLHGKGDVFFVRFPLIIYVEKTFRTYKCERNFPPLAETAWKLIGYLYDEQKKGNDNLIDLAEAAKKLQLVSADYNEKKSGFFRHVFQYLTDDAHQYAQYFSPQNDEYLTKIAQRGIEEHEKFMGNDMDRHQHTVQEVIMDTCNLTPPEVHRKRPTIVPTYSVIPMVKLAGEALLELSEQGIDLEQVITSRRWYDILNYFQHPNGATTFGTYTTYVATLAENVSRGAFSKAQRNYLALATLALYAARENNIDSEAPFLKEMLNAKDLLPSLCEIGVKLLRKQIEGKEVMTELYKVFDTIRLHSVDNTSIGKIASENTRETKKQPNKTERAWNDLGLPDSLKTFAEYMISKGGKVTRYQYNQEQGCYPSEVLKPHRHSYWKGWIKKHVYYPNSKTIGFSETPREKTAIRSPKKRQQTSKRLPK